MTETAAEYDATYYDGPAWQWFGLSYSSYVVLPRVCLCSMPIEWQQRFVALMDEAEARLPVDVLGAEYWIRRKTGNRFVADPLADYRHSPRLQLRDKDALDRESAP